MREAQEKAEKEAQKEQEREPEERSGRSRTKEYEVDFDVKETGQKKQIAGYDTRKVIMTVTVREKGKTLEEGGGLVMTTDMWLGPADPAAEGARRLRHALLEAAPGRRSRRRMSAEQMAMVLAMFPLRRQGDGAHEEGRRQARGHAARDDDDVRGGEERRSSSRRRRQQQKSSGGGGLGGMLAQQDHEEGAAEAARDDLHDAPRDARRSRPASTPADLAIPGGLQREEVERGFSVLASLHARQIDPERGVPCPASSSR